MNRNARVVLHYTRYSLQAELEQVDVLSPFGVYQGFTIGIARESHEDYDYESHFSIRWGFVDQIEEIKFEGRCHGNNICNSGLLAFLVI